MRFVDEELSRLDPITESGLSKLLENLCGEKISLGCTMGAEIACQNCQGCINRSVLSSRLKLATLSIEDLNDILLLADQFPLGAAFFDFFISQGKRTISFQELKDGVVRFKGYALLVFGNVRFAYRTLYKQSKEDLVRRLGRQHKRTATLKRDYSKRRNPVPLPHEISAKQTWLLGYIAKSDADRDFATYAAMACLTGLEKESVLLQGFSIQQKRLYEVSVRATHLFEGQGLC